MKYPLVFILLLTNGFPALAAASEPPGTHLPRELALLLERHRIPHNHLALHVQDVQATEPVVDFNGAKPFNPASVIKLLSTYVSLDVLGPDYHWLTEAYVDTGIKNSRLGGHLFLKGYGDPMFLADDLWLFLHNIKESGIREIAGDIIIDDSFFSPPPVHPAAFDDKPYRSYNALPSAFLTNFNSTELIITPHRRGKLVNTHMIPPNSRLEIINELRVNQARCTGNNRRVRFSVLDQSPTVIKLVGRYSLRCPPYTLRRSFVDSKTFSSGAVEGIWSQIGGSLKGTVRYSEVAVGSKMLYHQHRSRSLPEIIRAINKYSNNVMTQQLLLSLGAEVHGPPGTAAKGIQVIKDWLLGNALDNTSLIMENGAGLSRNTRLSAELLNLVLLKAYYGSLSPEFLSSLPLFSVDGSLKKRRLDRLPGINFRIKTGLIDHVRSLAGYVTSKRGNRYIVVALLNHPNVHLGYGKDIQKSLLQWVYGL